MYEPKYIEETLRWCNARRKEQGKEPLNKLPKGRRGEGSSCPCGEATGLFVSYTYFTTIQHLDREINLPRSVQRFVRAFDSGKLPQYDCGPYHLEEA